MSYLGHFDADDISMEEESPIENCDADGNSDDEDSGNDLLRQIQEVYTSLSHVLKRPRPVPLHILHAYHTVIRNLMTNFRSQIPTTTQLATVQLAEANLQAENSLAGNLQSKNLQAWNSASINDSKIHTPVENGLTDIPQTGSKSNI